MMCYKKRKRIFWISSTVIIFVFLIFECFPEIVEIKKNNEVSFSKEAGFYDEEFMLELSVPEGTIYYTLDGSIPDKSSIKYEEPFLVYDASKNENVYSARTDVSTGFETDEIERIGAEVPPGYQVPDYKVDKATVVRAVAYDGQGNRSEVTTSTYFVGFFEKNGYEGMNILSVVTDPENLFGYEEGIYVTGKEYDEYIAEYRNSDEWHYTEEYWLSWSANYRNRGAKWEREAYCQFFDEDGKLELSQSCGIRIHGGHSRGYTPKSLNFYARKEYDGNKVFPMDFFGTGYYPSELTLFQGGNEFRTRAKDYLISSEIKELNIASLNFEPYVMFLDGEYWGVYWLHEKYNKDYLEHYYDVSSDNVIMVKQDMLEEGEEEDLKYYYEMLEFCSESNLTEPENFEKVCEMIDIESYVDYYALMLYIARCDDWPIYNTALWRVKKEENGQYGDGKWRWILYDLNSAGFYPTMNSIEYVMENNEMFKNMMTNTTFRQMLIAQIEETMELFNYEKMEQRVEEYREFIIDKVKEHDKRFFGDDSVLIFNQELDAIDEFFKERKGYLLSILDQYR